MKVKDIVKKVNIARASGPIYLRNGLNEPVELPYLAARGYEDYPEANCTVTSIDLESGGKFIINYTVPNR